MTLTPAGLRCAHKDDPLGVAPDRIRFSWILQGAGQAQTAYQILVTRDETAVWDSGRIESPATTDIAYGGPPLAGRTGYRWKVQAWDETGAGSGWSAPAAFDTGFSERTGGWHASWITLGRIRGEFRPPSEPGPSDPVLNALMPAPYLRREFRVDQPVVAARSPAAGGGDGGRFTFSLDLPPNVTASVRIPSDAPAAVRDRAGAGPVSVAGYPGAPGAQEAVFAVGPGSHEFTGPALTAEFS